MVDEMVDEEARRCLYKLVHLLQTHNTLFSAKLKDELELLKRRDPALRELHQRLVEMAQAQEALDRRAVSRESLKDARDQGR